MVSRLWVRSIIHSPLYIPQMFETQFESLRKVCKLYIHKLSIHSRLCIYALQAFNSQFAVYSQTFYSQLTIRSADLLFTVHCIFHKCSNHSSVRKVCKPYIQKLSIIS